MPASRVGVPGFKTGSTSHSSFLLITPWKVAGDGHAFVSWLLMWKSQNDTSINGLCFGPSLGHYEHLRNEPAIKRSLSLHLCIYIYKFSESGVENPVHLREFILHEHFGNHAYILNRNHNPLCAFFS